MSDRELLSLFRKLSREIDARQRAQILRLRGIERALFEGIVERMVDELVTTSGRITTKRGEAKISEAIDKVFDALDRGLISEFAKASMKDLSGIMLGNKVYYKALYESTSKGKKFNAIYRRVNATMRKRLGIDTEGKVIGGSFLDRLFTSEPVRQEVKQVVMKAVTGGIPMSKLIRQLSVTVKGSQQIDGSMERYYKGFVLDTYQQYDRAINDQFADRLNMTSFSYEGGLIETSRAFCEQKNGKVFTVDEANRDWPNDPTLPRTTKEKETGVIIDYVPTVDLGRWQCRHRTRYMSEQMANRLKGKTPEVPTTTVDDVMDAAKKSAPQLDEIANRIARENGATVTPTDLKSKASIMRKASSEYGGDVSLVKDAVRNTIIAPKDGIEDVLKSLQDEGIFVRMKRQLADQDALGYSGNIVHVRMANGSLGEIQVNTATMIYAKESPVDARRILGDTLYDAIGDATGIEGGLGHSYYEEWRTLKPQIPEQAARMAEIESLSRSYYSNFYE